LIDIASLFSTIRSNNIAQFIIRPHLPLCRYGLMLQMM